MSEPKLALTGTVSDPIKLEAREEHNGEIPSRPDQQPERLLTLSMAAERLGLPTFKIRRAAKKGLFPTYSISNGRKLVRLSEVLATIERSRSESRR
jgi:hypothetical protein